MAYQALAATAPARAVPTSRLLALFLAFAMAFGPATVWSAATAGLLKSIDPLPTIWLPELTSSNAAKPDKARLAPPAAAFHLQANAADRDRAVTCLTDAIYYEAANEPEQAQRAVAQVVVNRLRDPHFPKSVCGVVYQGSFLRTGCQFSFTCDGSIQRRHAVAALWNRLKPLAEQALDGYVTPEVGAATFYYSDYVHPYWLAYVDPVGKLGKEVFCSWRGAAGTLAALTGAYQGGEALLGEAALDHGPLPPPPHRVARAGRTRVESHLRLARYVHHAARRRRSVA